MEVHSPIERAAAKLRQHGHEVEAINLEQLADNFAVPAAVEMLSGAYLSRAAINCAHEIDDEMVVLYFDSKQPGHNALNQLSLRLNAACTVLNIATPSEAIHG